MAVPGESLGEDIGDVVLGGDIGEVDRLVPQLLSDEVVLDVDGLAASAVVAVVGQMNGALVVVEQASGCWRCCIPAAAGAVSTT